MWQRMGENRKTCGDFVLENYKRREHFEDLGVDGRIIVIVIVIIYHDLGLDRLVSASADNLFKGLSRRLQNLVYNSA